jgi:hypothetical protein
MPSRLALSASLCDCGADAHGSLQSAQPYEKPGLCLQGKLLPGSHIPIVSDAVLYAPQVCCPPIGACCCTSVHMLAWV